MENNYSSTPRIYLGVMVSSTFTDLKEHRAALIKAIKSQGLTDVAMENDSAKPDGDVLDSSLQKVQDAAAYVCVISQKYGQIPECAKRNPNRLSLTELEFNLARELDRPVLLFIMGRLHPITVDDVEIDPKKIEKLNAFKENAKNKKSGSSVHRVYTIFNNLDEFKVAAMQAISGLAAYFKDHPPIQTESELVSNPKPDSIRTQYDPIPAPPAFYAEPPYIGSHQFLVRRAQLDILADWATPANAYPVLLFEAIGGTGKSILTWHWINKEAATLRNDWAGRFWYSFYEKGAVMADFCQRALAYMTGRSLNDFRKQKTTELIEPLLHHLRNRSWLIVLDGLERILVQYHRYDAAQLADDEAGTSDVIARRDPRAAIRPEDDDLLLRLAAAAPSKLLITTRLTPKVLLNPTDQPVSGVFRERLPGLRPQDAEALFRACGISGDGLAMRAYLQEHCDCHPLVIGVLAGLILYYLPDRGNFDAWAKDPQGGGLLNLADLNLVQKHNHILHFALDVLPEKSGQLLSTLALLSEAVDYPTLSALNPFLPREPEKVEKPRKPEQDRYWDEMSDIEKEQAHKHYQAECQIRLNYEKVMQVWQKSAIVALKELSNIVNDLERRGLLQYDEQSKRHDLHPVVRSIAAGKLGQEERERYGQRVVDHFSRQSHNPYKNAKTLEDLQGGLHVVRTLLRMGHYKRACQAYRGDIALALMYNLEAYSEILSLLRPFFSQGWGRLPAELDEIDGAYLTNAVGIALDGIGEFEEALSAYAASLLIDLREENWKDVCVSLYNIAETLFNKNQPAQTKHCILLALALAELTKNWERLFKAHLQLFRQLAMMGLCTEAKGVWWKHLLGRNWDRRAYRHGDAEFEYARQSYWCGNLQESDIIEAEKEAKKGNNRTVIRQLHLLRGQWHLEQCQCKESAYSLHEAVRMVRASGMIDATAETQLALVKFHLDQLPNPYQEAEQLAKTRKPAHCPLAELWLAIGNQKLATSHALAAYRWAWADGEPFVHRFELNKVCNLLKRLGEAIPNLPPYDPTKYEKFLLEDEVAAAIEQLRRHEAPGSR